MPARSWTIRARRAAAVTVAALAAGAAAGCGASDEARGLSGTERAQLQQRLSEVRQAAADRDPAAAETALHEFVDEVGALQLEGALDAETASALLTGAARARRQVAVEVTPPPPPEPEREKPEKEPEPKEGAGDDDDDGGKEKKESGPGKEDDGEGD
jgi:hypothetical protein